MAASSLSRSGRVLVIGGNGCLGRSIVNDFHLAGWRIISADVGSFPQLHPSVSTISLSETDGPSKQVDALLRVIDENHHQKDDNQSGFLDAVICVAGGWTGGKAGSEDFISSFERMNKMCLQPSVVAAQIAALRLRRSREVISKSTDGSGSGAKAFHTSMEDSPPIFALTGAAAALSSSSCQGMIGYGLAKNATHFLTQILSGRDSGLPLGSKPVCILPKMIDTPSNRKFMPDDDTSSWTPPEHIARQLLKWCGVDLNPPQIKKMDSLNLFPEELISGSLIVVETEQKKTSFRLM